MKIIAITVTCMIFAACGGGDDGLFSCTADVQCTVAGKQGHCVEGACAFLAPDCPSGLRYDKTAGAAAGQCTAAIDMGVPEVDDMATPTTTEPADMRPAPMPASTDSAPPTPPEPYKPLAWTLEELGNSALAGGVWAASPTEVYAVNYGAYVYKRTAGKWESIALGTASQKYRALFGIWGRAADDIYAIGASTDAGGLIIHYSSTANEWQRQSLPSSTSLRSIWGNKYGVWAVGDGSTIVGLRGTWETQHCPVTSELTGVWAAPDTVDVYAVGNTMVGTQSTILHAHGDALVPDWEAQNSPSTASLRGVWGSSSADVYAVGINGTIMHSKGDGKWTLQADGVPTDKILNCVWGSSPTDIYVGGEGGLLLHSAGDGKWTKQETLTTVDLTKIYGSGPGDVYVATFSGAVLHGVAK